MLLIFFCIYTDTSIIIGLLYLQIINFLISHSAHLHNLSRRLSYFVYKFESHSQEKLLKHLKKINKDRAIINQVELRNQKKLVKLCTEHAEMFRKRLQKVINRKGINKLDLTEIKLK